MTKEEIYDINGKQPKVGDTIAYSVGWGTGNAYINIATIESFEERPNTVKMNLTILKTGLDWGDYGFERKTSLQFPVRHCKFVII